MGIHCTRRSVDCLSSPTGELCGHGTCVQTNDVTGYKCICDQGWTTNGISVACTVDVDECADTKLHCSMEPRVQCINLPGTYMCGLCPAGYIGNGHYCSDVDECETNNGGCSTNPSVTCINTRVSPKPKLKSNCVNSILYGTFRDHIIVVFVQLDIKVMVERALVSSQLMLFLEQTQRRQLDYVPFPDIATH